jgi:hypothetical protein
MFISYSDRERQIGYSQILLYNKKYALWNGKVSKYYETQEHNDISEITENRRGKVIIVGLFIRPVGCAQINHLQ